MRRSVPLAIFAFLLLAGIAFEGQRVVQGSGDVGLYNDIGRRAMEARHDPAKKIESEYPPLQTSLFLLLHRAEVLIPFPVLWILLFILTVGATCAYELWVLRGPYAPVLCTTLLACFLFLGPELTIARYDFLLFLLLFLCWRAHSAERHGESGFFLLIAIGCKVVPILLLPALIIVTPFKKRDRLLIGCIVGAIFVFLIPAILLGPARVIENIQYLSMYHSARGFQAESMWSSVQFLIARLLQWPVDVQLHHGAWHNVLIAPWLDILSTVIVLGGAALLSIFFWIQSKKGKTLPLLLCCCLLLLWALFWSPVLSPQYLVWIMPLALLWFFGIRSDKSDDSSLYIMAFTACFMGIATGYFSILGGVEKGEFPMLALLLARNFSILLLFLQLLRTSVSGHFVYPAASAAKASGK